jgi:hypothetical protein
MKELDTSAVPAVLAIEQQAPKQQKENLKLLHVHRLKIDGGKIWEVDLEAGTAIEATYQQSTTYDVRLGAKKRLIIKPGLIYVEAINSINAFRKATNFSEKHDKR